MPRYVIDCGHGGDDPAGGSTPVGVVGPGGLREKDVTLAVGRRVAACLGPEARLTRGADINLALGSRAALARRERADVFLSLHADDAGRHGAGAQTWIHPRASEPSTTLAQNVQRELARLGGGSRGVQRGDLAVLHPEAVGPGTAACLVEMAVLSNPRVERRLREPASLDAMAAAIAQGARAAYGGARAPLAHALADDLPAEYDLSIEMAGVPVGGAQGCNFWESPNVISPGVSISRPKLVSFEIDVTTMPPSLAHYSVHLFKWWLVKSDEQIMSPYSFYPADMHATGSWTGPEDGRYYVLIWACTKPNVAPTGETFKAHIKLS